jgi:hypothetical protein
VRGELSLSLQTDNIQTWVSLTLKKGQLSKARLQCKQTIPDNEIIKNIFDQTNKTISKQALSGIRNRIKRNSYQWYKTMREGQYEYIHEFKERINEILSLQKLYHQIIDSPTEPTTVKQTSMAELHRLNNPNIGSRHQSLLQQAAHIEACPSLQLQKGSPLNR